MKEAADPAELLRKGLALLGVPDVQRACALLEKHLAEIERWNPRFGLVKHAGREELVVRHVLDSLAAWTAVRDAARSASGAVLDVGSGAGFPGIPLAVVLPDVPFTLLERMSRRAAFLRTCGVLLGCSNLRVLACDLGEVRESFAVVTFRAVAPLDRFLTEIERSGVRWETILAYKGKEERALQEIREAQRTREGRGAMEVKPLQSPFLDEERCLIVVRSPHD